ncbi:MAG: OmpH family outer membrane protein [Bacteroidales bacterium]|nr:OmpH family outer membrane protein [Bacteroidales bacterium]MCF8404497.1 OmpH family outer membrane protein [Bacteroidales bacterium]
MKTIGLILLMIGMQVGMAQQVAYIETDKILDKIPEFELANNDIDQQVKQWESELDNKFTAIETMYQEYVKSEAGLTPEMKQQKQEAIMEAEKKANNYKDEIFGREGEMAKLQQQKLKPFYDKIYNAAEVVAKENSFDYVFEKTDDGIWVYTNPALNITDEVIQHLKL